MRWLMFLILSFALACQEHPDHHHESAKTVTTTPGQPDAATAAMIDSVQKAQAAVDPMKAVFMSRQREQILKQRMQGANALAKANMLVAIGFEQLKSGLTREAIATFQEALKEVAPLNIPGKEQTVLEVQKLEALGYLRLGEQENCILNHTSASCIIPIAKPGQHQKTEGSSRAMELYEEILQKTPDDLTSRFLLNIAAMTLGDWPQGVPKSMQLPDGFLASKVSFPAFPDIAAELGFTKGD